MNKFMQYFIFVFMVGLATMALLGGDISKVPTIMVFADIVIAYAAAKITENLSNKG